MWSRSYRKHVIMAFPSFDAATNSWAAVPLANTGAAITSWGQDNDGELYMVTFDKGILKLVPK